VISQTFELDKDNKHHEILIKEKLIFVLTMWSKTWYYCKCDVI